MTPMVTYIKVILTIMVLNFLTGKLILVQNISRPTWFRPNFFGNLEVLITAKDIEGYPDIGELSLDGNSQNLF